MARKRCLSLGLGHPVQSGRRGRASTLSVSTTSPGATARLPVMAGFDPGDTIRIASTPETIAAGYAGRIGTYYGWTTPSVTSVEVVGDRGENFAIGITFDGAQTAWFHPSLIEPVPEAH